MLDIRYLAPHKSLISNPKRPGERQGNVIVAIALLWRERPAAPALLRSSWLIEASNHALGRFLQLAPGADLQDALFQAACAFTMADCITVITNANALYLGGGPGVWAGELIN
jgi:hypothetical protein